MTFRTQAELDGSTFMNSDEFAEAVTFYANGTGGGVAVNAVVERYEQSSDEFGSMQRAAAIINVRDDASAGVTAFDVDDEWDVALREGGTSARYRANRVISKDFVIWKIEVVE